MNEQTKAEQRFICDGCRVRPPFEHRCAGDGCECKLCVVVCDVCGLAVPERKARDWKWEVLSERVLAICSGCLKPKEEL